MDILENRDGWLKEFRQGWLAHLQETGQANWKIYNRPTNEKVPDGPGIDPRKARLILISTAGGYLRDLHEPFDDSAPLGDHSMREFPLATPLDEIAFSHGHYDHTAVDDDPEVLLPLRLLEQLEHEGIVGELCEDVISLMGYQPDATRTVDETIPAVLASARRQYAQAALLVPS